MNGWRVIGWLFAAVKLKIILKRLRPSWGSKLPFFSHKLLFFIANAQIDQIMLKILILIPKLVSTHFLEYLHLVRIEEEIHMNYQPSIFKTFWSIGALTVKHDLKLIFFPSKTVIFNLKMDRAAFNNIFI